MPGTLSAFSLVTGERQREETPRGSPTCLPSVCVTDPFSVSRERSQKGTFVHLHQPISFPMQDRGHEAPGSPAAALCSPNPTCCSAQAETGISCAGKLESDPWRGAWSPWQPRIYYRGLHPAWRTFDLKRETGNQEVNPGSIEPTGAALGPPRW